MPKLLISCDDYIFSHNGKYYFKNKDSQEFYDRYMRIFPQIRIADRCIAEDSLKAERIEISDSRIEVCPLPIFHGPKEYARKYFATGRAIRMVADGCDAAVLRLPSTVATRIAWQVMKKGIPYAVEVVFDAHDGAATAKSRLHKIIWNKIDRQMRRICRQADGVACVTEHYLQQRYYSEKPLHFVAHYSSLGLKRGFYAQPRRYPDVQPMTIAHVSNQIRLDGRKGEANIIKALALLKREGLVVNIEFAGDDWDNSTEKINQFAKENGVTEQVKCIGFLSRQQMSEFLDRCQLFVLPTKAEGLPRVIIEAIAKALPVITTPASGNPELIPNKFMVDYDDIEGIARLIKEIVTHPDVYESASKQNYEHSLLYEASILEKRRDAFYTNLLNIVESHH